MNAKEARKTAESNNGSNLDSIIKKIKEAVQAGAFECLIYDKISTEAKFKLEEMGYAIPTLNQFDSREGEYLTKITW